MVVKGRLDLRDDTPKLIAMEITRPELAIDGGPPVRVKVKLNTLVRRQGRQAQGDPRRAPRRQPGVRAPRELRRRPPCSASATTTSSTPATASSPSSASSSAPTASPETSRTCVERVREMHPFDGRVLVRGGAGGGWWAGVCEARGVQHRRVGGNGTGGAGGSRRAWPRPATTSCVGVTGPRAGRRASSTRCGRSGATGSRPGRRHQRRRRRRRPGRARHGLGRRGADTRASPRRPARRARS